MIEFDVDMGYLLEEGELDRVILNDENGEHEPMTFRQGGGECEMDVLDTGNEAAYEYYEHIMHCANCHHEFGYVQYDEDGDTWMDDKPRFCPNCGKAVKR